MTCTSPFTFNTNPFDFPPVIYEVCKSLSTRELLQCSLVNQTWNISARIILRDYKPCLLQTSPGKACLRLKAFENALLQQNLPFINGLSFKVNYNDDHCRRGSCVVPTRHEDGTSIGDIMFNRLQIRHLEIDWQGNYRAICNCPVVLLLRKCIRERPHEIISIRLEHIPRAARLFHPMNSQDELQFPNLRVLKSNQPHNRIPFNVVLRLIATAPNLEEYDFEVNCSDIKLGRVPGHKLDGIKFLMFRPSSTANLAQFERVANVNSPLRKLVAHAPLFKRLDLLMRGWNCLHRLTANSLNTLTSIRAQALVIIMMDDMRATSSCGSFLSVTDLAVEVPLSDSADALQKALTSVNFNALFPAVSGVKVEAQPVYRRELDHSLYGKFNSPQANTCAQGSTNIQKVKLGYCWSSPMTPIVMKIFTNARQVEAKARECPMLWEWAGLERIEITQWTSDCLDWKFCGIASEEAEWLQNQSDEFLKAYNFAPIRKPFHYQADLRNLTINYYGGAMPYSKQGTTLLSKVTYFLSLRHMKDFGFCITCTRTGPTVLQHLKDYVTFVVKERAC